MINLTLLHKLVCRDNVTGVTGSTVCEVGVNSPSLCRVAELYDLGAKTILVEPLRRHADALKERFRKASIYPIAIGSHNRQVMFQDDDQCSHFSEQKYCPGYVNKFHKPGGPSVNVEMRQFEMIDTGTIDLLAADVEGAEWYVLETMKSRPRVIVLETHLIGFPYKNPFMREINEWMDRNGYRKLCDDSSDTCWVRI